MSETVKLPRVSVPANYYETPNWKENRAARQGVKHCFLSEVKAARINVEWIKNTWWGCPDPIALASLAYVAGIRAGIHRERQRRKGARGGSHGLASQQQVTFLERRGFQRVETWTAQEAGRLVDQIAANGWKIPPGVNPSEYRPS